MVTAGRRPSHPGGGAAATGAGRDAESGPGGAAAPGWRRLGAAVANPALVAVVLALAIGVAIAVLTPPETGADERDHFTRAYQISRGDLLTHRQGTAFGAYLPASFAAEEARLAALAYSSPDRTAFVADLGQAAPHGPAVFVSTGNAASYGPGAYAPYVAALVVGRLMRVSTLGLLYLARLAGVVSYALILGLAVTRIPVHKWMLAGVGLLPSAVNQASTVSADGMTMVLSFLVVADALRLGAGIGRKRPVLVETALAAAVLALAKPPYVLLLATLAVPAWRFRGRLAGAVWAVWAGAAALAVLWGAYQLGHAPSQANPKAWLYVAPHSYAFHGIRTTAQTVYVLTHPWSFLAAVGRTFVSFGSAFPKQLFGMLALYQMPWSLVALAAVGLVVACVAPSPSAPPRRLGRADRVAAAVVALVVALGVFAIAYANWNQYRAPRIDAVNTRYLLPLLPALLVGVLPDQGRPRRRRLAWKGWRPLFVALAVTAGAGAVIGVAHYHYSHPTLAATPTQAAGG